MDVEKSETRESGIESEMDRAREVYESETLHFQIREGEERDGAQRIR